MGFSGPSLGTRNARKSIQGSKASYSSREYNQSLSHYFGSLSGWWRHKRINKKAKPILFLTTLTENPKPNLKSFFSVETRRLHQFFEGSNSSLACSRGEASWAAPAASGKLMQFFYFCAQRGFWAITLVPDRLEGQSRAL